MAKSLILSVAGSGKTTHLVNLLNEGERFMLITYTRPNVSNLRASIIREFGYMPSNISLMSYYSFLFNFCYKPFRSRYEKAKGMDWNRPPDYTGRIPLLNPRRYLSESKYLYHNRLAKYLEILNLYPRIQERLETFYDHLLVDEVQDFAGHDFNLLQAICQANIEVVMVGDFYQHTYDTSRDGSVNRTLHNELEAYKQRFRANGVEIDSETLSDSHRCPPSVTSFITDHVGIEIGSHNEVEHQVTHVTEPDDVRELFQDPNIVKLFFRNSSRYPGNTQNWGKSKGIDTYQDVCVVLNPTTLAAYQNGELEVLASETRNKLYVACSRAKRNLFFISEAMLAEYRNN